MSMTDGSTPATEPRAHEGACLPKVRALDIDPPALRSLSPKIVGGLELSRGHGALPRSLHVVEVGKQLAEVGERIGKHPLIRRESTAYEQGGCCQLGQPMTTCEPRRLVVSEG
jgi:hypothetical protein